jgi:hypothetical protein
VTKETLDVATERGITVEEIIRNHQAYDAFQESIQPRYIARNTTKLRFDIGGGAEALEAAIAGDYFSDRRPASADWVWSDFFINGVKWKYGSIPELPLIQPEKVTQLPLDIHLSNEYRYELVRATDLLGYRVYEVRFEPPPNAPEGAAAVSRHGVDRCAHVGARPHVMVQLNLTGEVLSNEERVDFVAVLARDESAADDRRRREERSARADLAAAGGRRAAGDLRGRTRERRAAHDDLRQLPPRSAGVRDAAREVSASDARMVRETERGCAISRKKTASASSRKVSTPRSSSPSAACITTPASSIRSSRSAASTTSTSTC